MEARTRLIEDHLRCVPLQDRLTAHLREIVRERDPVSAPEGHAHVREYVRRRLAAYGRVTPHEHGHRPENLVLDLPDGRTVRSS